MGNNGWRREGEETMKEKVKRVEKEDVMRR
jgi:hypothetical protein